jgi:phosphopantetheinyl transferase
VPLNRNVTHPHKRLQHLAGRFLLQYLFPDFPYELIQLADTRKPYLPDEQYHFSISHCGDYAAAIVSSRNRVGVDVEIPVEKIERIKDKFLSDGEKSEWGIVNSEKLKVKSETVPTFDESTAGQPGSRLTTHDYRLPTLLWSCKEAIFKWHGDGGVDFRKDIQLFNQQETKETIDCFFSRNESELVIHYRQFDELVLAWVSS